MNLYERIDQRKIDIILVVLCLLVTPFARAGEIPIILMALFGAYFFAINEKGIRRNEAVKIYFLLFLMIWIPVLLSIPGAANFNKTFVSGLIFIRFFFLGVFVILFINSKEKVDTILKFSSFLLFFWIFDALFQYVIGYDLLGFKQIAGRANGVFGKHLKLGLYLGAFLPIIYYYSVLNLKKRTTVFIFLLAFLTILLAGSRAGWIMFIVGLAGQLVLLYDRYRYFPKRLTLVFLVVIIGFVSVSYHSFPSFAARVKQSALIFSMDSKLVDQALSTRLPIWKTGLAMYQDNYFNGVGARGFRYAYNNYADEGDIYVDEERGIGAYHSHNIIVEIASETGTVGLVGFVLFCIYFTLVWSRSTGDRRFFASPFALSLFVALFPFNTHFAFYAGAWTQVMFWLLALMLASLTCPKSMSGNNELSSVP